VRPVIEYHVKWRLAADKKTAEHYIRSERRSEALDFACAVLQQKPADIWVEDEYGARIAEKENIIDHCRRRSSFVY
jgi:hypothetical protein